MKENPVPNFEINTISYVVSLINFIDITLIYHITKPCDFEKKIKKENKNKQTKRKQKKKALSDSWVLYF
jgi:hypothetical protein